MKAIQLSFYLILFLCSAITVNAQNNSCCGVNDVTELDFLSPYIGNCNYEAIYGFVQDGQEYIYVVADGLCENSDGTFTAIADIENVLFDCEGNIICYEGGEGPQDTQCSFNAYDVSSYVTPSNLKWAYEASSCCGVDDVTELEFLSPYIGNCNYEAIYGFVQDGQEYIYVVADGLCENSDGTFTAIADIENVLFDCEGNIICYEGGEGPQNIQCSFNGYDVSSYLIPANLKWAYEATSYCGVNDVTELDFLSRYLDDCNYESIYSFVLNGEEYIYVVADGYCEYADGTISEIADIPNILYNCQGTIICIDGGEGPEGLQCSFYDIDVSPYLTPANQKWEYKTPTCCGVDDITDLDFLAPFIDNCEYEAIYGFELDGQEYIYVVADGFCEYPDGTISVTSDLGNILFDCEGNFICAVGGFTTPEAQCSFQGIDVTPFIKIENLKWVYKDPILVSPKVYLQGAYVNAPDNLMRDNLRANGLIPLNEPYTGLPDFNGSGENINLFVLETTGANAIVDWVYIDLYKTDGSIAGSRSALLQRDGDIVDVNGSYPVAFYLPEDEYSIRIRHRNHLSVSSQNAFGLNSAISTTIDFNTVEIFGANAMVEMPNAVKAMWGSANAGQVVFQGPGNIPNAVFFDVLTAPGNTSSTSNYIYEGEYKFTDLDMNGEIIFQGANNDVNFTFFTILQHPENTLLSPNFIIYEQNY